VGAGRGAVGGRKKDPPIPMESGLNTQKRETSELDQDFRRKKQCETIMKANSELEGDSPRRKGARKV